MKRILYSATVVSVSLFVVFYSIYKFTDNDICQILYITFMTFSYHCVMRLIVGLGIGYVHKGEYNYNAKWFQQRDFEKKLYKKLNVKKWKEKVPAWSPQSFETKYHTYDEIVQSMCNAEVVHEIIIVFSFVPILFSLEYGVPIVFIITSVLAAAVDSVFVAIQRYNRPRIVRLISKKER